MTILATEANAWVAAKAGIAYARVPPCGTKELSPAPSALGRHRYEPESRRDDRRMPDDVFCRAYGTPISLLTFSQPSITPTRATPARVEGPDERLGYTLSRPRRSGSARFVQHPSPAGGKAGPLRQAQAGSPLGLKPSAGKLAARFVDSSIEAATSSFGRTILTVRSSVG